MQSKNLTISALVALLIPCILTPPSTALTPQEIAQMALKSTVLVVMTNASGQSFYGSGFVVSKGQVATNYHVIEGIVSGTVQVVGETTKHAIEVVLAVDPARDLAIVQATGISAPPLLLGDSDTVQIGQAVYVAGNPQGLEGTFSQGIISAIRPEGNNLVRGKIFQMTAPISPGSSGGPVLDVNGEVIGVAVGQTVNGQNLNYAVPVSYLKTLTRTIQSVNIPDPNLRAAIAAKLGKASSGTITASDMTTLTRLDAPNSNISVLTGLEFATNLTGLDLGSEKIGDTWINSNTISDISPLAELTNLEWLGLSRNSISDISTLAKLTHLEWLHLSHNSISDISTLAKLTHLEWLSLQLNSIEDISALSGLTQLKQLYLGGNVIADVSPLSGLTNLEILYLWGNALRDISGLASLTNLTTLLLHRNAIGDISALSGLANLEDLRLGENPIGDTSPLCKLQNKKPELKLDIEITCSPYDLFMQDFNQDGKVNLSDLFFILTLLFSASDNGDINNDGNTDFLDLVSVAESISESATSAAPAIGFVPVVSLEIAQAWIDMAHAADDGSLAFQQGIANLKRFLAAMRPDKSELLPNYPNPFNPETWIPYRLAHAADVTLTIYDTTGALVRQLDLGLRPAGDYTDKAQAAYWDGRNNLGEPVGSGVYSYQLQAGTFSATRKLVILK